MMLHLDPRELGLVSVGRGFLGFCGGCGRPLLFEGDVFSPDVGLAWDALRVPQVCAGDPDSDELGAAWTVYACGPVCEGRVNDLDGAEPTAELMLHAPDATVVLESLAALVRMLDSYKADSATVAAERVACEVTQ